MSLTCEDSGLCVAASGRRKIATLNFWESILKYACMKEPAVETSQVAQSYEVGATKDIDAQLKFLTSQDFILGQLPFIADKLILLIRAWRGGIHVHTRLVSLASGLSDNMGAGVRPIPSLLPAIAISRTLVKPRVG